MAGTIVGKPTQIRGLSAVMKTPSASGAVMATMAAESLRSHAATNLSTKALAAATSPLAAACGPIPGSAARAVEMRPRTTKMARRTRIGCSFGGRRDDGREESVQRQG